MQFISDFSPRPYPTHSKQRKCATTMMSERPLLDLLGSRDPMMHCATVVLRAISRFVKRGASLQVAKRLTMMRLIGTMVPTRLSRVSPSRVTLFSVGQASDCSNSTVDTHTHRTPFWSTQLLLASSLPRLLCQRKIYQTWQRVRQKYFSC